MSMLCRVKAGSNVDRYVAWGCGGSSPGKKEAHHGL